MASKLFSFSPEDVATLNAVFEAETENFVELMTIARLDPKKHFRNGDFSEVDFTSSDLRGFDFTGSNLKNTYGENVVWDETTILDGAALEGSLFLKRQ